MNGYSYHFPWQQLPKRSQTLHLSFTSEESVTAASLGQIRARLVKVLVVLQLHQHPAVGLVQFYL